MSRWTIHRVNQKRGQLVRIDRYTFILCIFLSQPFCLPYSDPPKATSFSQSRPNLDPDATDLPNEDGEAMDDTNDDDAAMMALMGLSNFGSTKVRRCYHLLGVEFMFYT